MQKEGCICITITILTAIIGIIVLVLYFTLGRGDNGGNNVTIDDNSGNGKRGNGDNNIIQKTSQGGIHILECYGQLHVNWQALLAVGLVILVILVIKWAIQYNWCKLFSTCKGKESESRHK